MGLAHRCPRGVRGRLSLAVRNGHDGCSRRRSGACCCPAERSRSRCVPRGPPPAPDLAAHLRAWALLLSQVRGLPPIPDNVSRAEPASMSEFDARSPRSNRRCDRCSRPRTACPSVLTSAAMSWPQLVEAMAAGTRPGGGRRRTCLRVPVRPARLSGAAAPCGRRDRADRSDRAARPLDAVDRARRRASGCSTPRARICRASPRWAMVPDRVFDTELAGRLLGLPRVGLGPIVEAELGLSLAKEHSAADWSTRPLPESWLRYAALDVDVLVDLRDVLGASSRRRGQARLGGAGVRGRPARPSAGHRSRMPWRRRTQTVRDPRGLAIVRELWTTRERVARDADIAPGRVLPDAAMVAAGVARSLARSPSSPSCGSSRTAVLRGGCGPGTRRWPAHSRLPDGELPPRRAPHEAGSMPAATFLA